MRRLVHKQNNNKSFSRVFTSNDNKMDKSKWLSPEQVIQTLGKKSNKDFLDKFLSLKDDAQLIELDESKRRAYIEDKIDEQFDALNEVNVKLNSNLGVLEWLSDRNESVVQQFKNKPQFMGRSELGKIYLNNEETLFLIDTSSAVCYHRSLQLSLQDAFSLMIKNDLEYERYVVYAYLLRFGYRVRRASTRSDLKVDLIDDSIDQVLGDECTNDELVKDEKDEISKNSNFKKINVCKVSNGDEICNDDVKDSKDQSVDQVLTELPDEASKIQDFIKRPIDTISDVNQQEIKKLKLTAQLNNLRPSIEIIKLDELIKDLHLIDENNELDFMKFIRFRKLGRVVQHNWKELIDDYHSRQVDRPAILVQGIDQINNLDALKDDKNTRALYNDFLTDTPLIKLNESLTDDELQSRLAQFGPQLDLSDSLLDDIQISNNAIYDYDVYLPSRKQKIQNTEPDYYLKILHFNQHHVFPIDEIFHINSKIADRRKLLFVICASNEFNFYQFTDVNLINY